MSQRTKAKKTLNEAPQPFVNYKSFGLARNFKLADIVTLCNSFCGCLSIFTALELVLSLKGGFIAKESFSEHQINLIRIAFVLPFLGGLFDVLDGKIARLTTGGASMLGQELDSLSDLISFGVAPTVLGFVIGLQTFGDRICLAAYCCAGLARLARFNVTVHTIQQDETGKAKYFEGLPIPTSLCLVLIMYYWFEFGMLVEGNVPFGVVELPVIGKIHVWTFAFLLHAVAMTSNRLRVPKF